MCIGRGILVEQTKFFTIFMIEFKKATFGMGCFWCAEAVFQRLKGVKSVAAGYAGGALKNPTYEDVCTGTTGHAEVIQIEYDPTEIRYEDLLYVFFRLHNPTQLNRQGADIGTQYRSIIFTHDEEQKALVEQAIGEVQKDYDQKIVTEILPYTIFYPAESYHKDYYNKNSDAPYCQYVIDPKIQALKKLHLPS